VGARKKVENFMGDTLKRGRGHGIEPKFLPFHILLSKIPIVKVSLSTNDKQQTTKWVTEVAGLRQQSRKSSRTVHHIEDLGAPRCN
jgi:hypothetical protein